MEKEWLEAAKQLELVLTAGVGFEHIDLVKILPRRSVRCLAELDKLLPTTDICITTPFWPAYLDKERLEKAKKLELSLTAGVGSAHIELHAAAKKGITVAEVRHQYLRSCLDLLACQSCLLSTLRHDAEWACSVQCSQLSPRAVTVY